MATERGAFEEFDEKVEGTDSALHDQAEKRLNDLHKQAKQVIATAAGLQDVYGRESKEYADFLTDMTKALSSDLAANPAAAGTQVIVLFSAAVDIGAQILLDSDKTSNTDND